MPSFRLENEQDIRDFISGLKLLGTGGGGSPTSGFEMLNAALAEGLQLSWTDINDLPEDVFTCTAFGSGSISEERPDSLEGIEKLAKKLGIPNKYGYRAPEIAVKELEEYSGVKIGGIVPVEVGASNTPAPMITAARLGVHLVDGDYSGRAVPQEMQTGYFLKGFEICPAAIVDWWGDVMILKEGASPAMIERIGKLLATASYGVVYFASVLLSKKDTQEAVVPGTLTLSYQLGQAIHQAAQQGKDPVEAARVKLDGWRLFEGVVTGKDWSDEEEGMVGTVYMDGVGDYAGHTMKVWFLNENHVAWLDEKPCVFSPDLIILADPTSGEGYTNTEIKTGDPVAVLGSRVAPMFRSEKAIAHFGPRYWGFDFDYVPIEEVMVKPR